ncbi:HotDog domain-containing protein [Nemania sp. NC0429]|nr:HotDog domain-containing protein [Nemania sp. NC0429]
MDLYSTTLGPVTESPRNSNYQSRLRPGRDQLRSLNMLRSSQRLCHQALARPYGGSLLRGGISSGRLRATIAAARPHPPRALPPSTRPRPRYFATSISRLAQQPRAREDETLTGPTTATATATEAADLYPGDASSPGPQRPERRRRVRGIYYAAVFLLLGAIGGTFARITIAPPPLPAAGSDKDVYLQAKIRERGAALPLVQQLSADPSWTSWDAYAGVAATATATADATQGPRGISAVQSRITSGPMAGSSGLAFQRIFHNASTGEVVTVVYFGAALAGWPGVVHGGALATLLDESLGRCAILKFPSHTGVTANLELQYRAPTLTNAFYVIRTTPVVSEGDDVVGRDGVRKGDRKLWVWGTLETEKGKVAVEAKALFVVPKGYKLRPLVQDF